jgi:hypothetical protein
MGARLAWVIALMVFACALPARADSPSGDDDGDGVPNSSDACPSRHGGGTINGCPRATVGLAAYWNSRNGTLTLTIFTVTATPGADVTVACTGTCPRPSVSFRATGRPQSLTAFLGHRLARGTLFETRVTSPGSIGTYKKATVHSNGLVFTGACLEPGSPRPRKHCTGTSSAGPSADDTDGDAVPNAADQCPREHGEGMRSGCPPVDVTSSFSSKADHGQARLTRLDLVTLPGALVIVQCSRSTTCPRERVVRIGHGRTVLPGYAGLLVPLGTTIEARVLRQGSIGAYRRWTATGLGLDVRTKCIEPGGWTPKAECSGTPTDEQAPNVRPWLDPFPLVADSDAPVGRRTLFASLTVRRLARGARVDVRCAGSGCPFHHRARLHPRGGVIPKFARASLGSGSLITVRVTQRGRVGLYAQLRMRAHRDPARHEGCLLPGSSSPRTCPVRP